MPNTASAKVQPSFFAVLRALAVRLFGAVFGLFLCAAGSYLTIQANVGLAPWEALGVGISNVTGILYGNAVVAIGVVLILIDFLLKEEIGVVTLLNTILIGKFVDLLRWLHPVPLMHHFAAGIAVLLTGHFLVCIGSYFYIRTGLGCGPRDSLMVAIGKRLSRLPIGLAKGLLEGSVLLLGFLMGAKVGLGTVISVFGISFMIEFTYNLLRFDVRSVRHENIRESWRQLKAAFAHQKNSAPPETK